MPFKELIDLVYKYGAPVVYSGVFMFVLYRFGTRVMDSYERREASYSTMINSGMASITAALQELNKAHMLNISMYERVSKDLKDGFDRLHDANKFQRDEHKEILEKIDRSENMSESARERILNAVKEVCKKERS